MSRTPIREAMRRLQAEGLLLPGGRGGMIVPALEPGEVADLYVLRATLEALAAQLAAGRQADGHVPRSAIAELLDAARAFELVAHDDTAGLARANGVLHKRIAAMAANQFLYDALARIWDRIAISSRSNLGDADWREQVIEDHRRIVAAIEAGASDDAATAMREHILAAIEQHRAMVI
jgi:DNA-binding GntR family transcriptional regulator